MSSLQDDELTAIREEFAEWRRSKKGRTVPDDLWRKAIALLDTHRQSHVCELLRVNSNRLAMKRFELCGIEPDPRRSGRKPRKQRFVEIPVVAPEALRTPAEQNSKVKLVAERADGARLTFEMAEIDGATVGTVFEHFLAPSSVVRKAR